MFRFAEEGGNLKYGFNFYPLRDKYNLGFRFKYSEYKMIIVRWSKNSKKFHIQNIDRSKVSS
jgi:hypothetical protein